MTDQNQEMNPEKMPVSPDPNAGNVSETITGQPQPAEPEESEWLKGLQPANRVNVLPVMHVADAIKEEIAKVIVGQEVMVEMLLAGMLVGGHVLLEGLPGIAKTLMAKLLARTIDAGFSRIQFTPDLMPTDVTGTSVFNMKDSTFSFRQGPVFSNIILIDEINRAPAKTQASLMEVMEEKQITYDGHTYAMGFPFFVLATQNPIEQEGTYSLPEAQLDRFIFRLKMGYPSLDQEQQILHRFQHDFTNRQQAEVRSIVKPDQLRTFSDLIEKVYIRTELLNYIASVVHNTRNNGDLHLGASPRASLAVMKSSKALAAIRGREYVTPDDVRRACIPVLNHRVILSHEREMEGHTVEEIITDILKKIEIPR